MDDITPDTSAPVADTPVADSAPTTDPVVPTQDAVEIDPLDLPDGVDQFSREYVQRLRDEAAKNRTRAKEVTDRFSAFQSMPEPLADGMLRFVQDFANEDTRSQAAWGMFQSLGGVLGVEPERLQSLFEAAEEAGVTEELGELSPEQIRDLARSEFSKVRQEVETERLEAEIAAAFNSAVGEGDPQQYILAYHYMGELGLPLNEAIARYQDERASYEANLKAQAIEEYLREKAGQGGAPVPSAGASPATQLAPPRNRDERRARLVEGIKSLSAQNQG